MQILRRTGTENTIRQKARKDSNDGVPNDGVPGVPERLSPDAARHIDIQPQIKEKRFVFLLSNQREKCAQGLSNMQEGCFFSQPHNGWEEKGWRCAPG